MLRFERPAPGLLAAARAETGVVDCLVDGDRPSPFEVVEGDWGRFRALPGLVWLSAPEVLRPCVGVDGFLAVPDMTSRK